MKQDDKFTVINIREYLKKNADDEEQFGEDALRQLPRSVRRFLLLKAEGRFPKGV